MKIDEPTRGEIEKLPALAWAIKRGHYEAFKALLDAGADPYELYRGPGQGDTGLMYVAGGGSFYTPLSYAMSGDSQNPKIIDTLLNLPHFKRYAHSETHAFYKFMLILATDEGGERQNYAQAIVERFKKEGFRPNSSDIELEEEMKKATKQEKASPARVQSPPEEPVNPVAKKREITLSSLYTAGSLKDFKTTLKDSIAQNELNALCRESNLTRIAIDSIESRRTPQAITLHLFDVAYRLGLPIDYKKVLEKAQKANAKEIVKAAHYYGGFEPAPQNVEERYTKYVDAGMIDKALEYYLSHAKELNAVQGMHNWSKAPLTGTLKSGYGEYEKKTQYANGLKEGRLHVIKPNGDPFAIAEYKHGIMIYGVIVHDADKGEATVCSFDSYGILKGCSEHSSDKKPFTPKLSRERVREILGEL
jgi:hypothetical protein